MSAKEPKKGEKKKMTMIKILMIGGLVLPLITLCIYFCCAASRMQREEEERKAAARVADQAMRQGARRRRAMQMTECARAGACR